MSTDSGQDTESYSKGLVVGTAYDTAEAFSSWGNRQLGEHGLFHSEHRPFNLLMLSDIPKDSRVLDIGSGKGQLVASLRENGIHAIGVDLASKKIDQDTILQNPDILANSIMLPFADRSFDYSLNFYGGLSYPQERLILLDGNREVARNIVLASLNQMREAIRVTSGEVRTYPWSSEGLFEASGLFIQSDDKYNPLITAIDYQKLFGEMGINFKFGLSYGDAPLRPPRKTLILDVRDGVDFRPMDDLISVVAVTDKPVSFRVNDIDPQHPDFKNIFWNLWNHTAYNFFTLKEIANFEEEVTNFSQKISSNRNPGLYFRGVMAKFDHDGQIRRSLGLGEAATEQTARAIFEFRKVKYKNLFDQSFKTFSEEQRRILTGKILNRDN
jgi:SAM-dependent methyltransferase